MIFRILSWNFLTSRLQARDEVWGKLILEEKLYSQSFMLSQSLCSYWTVLSGGVSPSTHCEHPHLAYQKFIHNSKDLNIDLRLHFDSSTEWQRTFDWFNFFLSLSHAQEARLYYYLLLSLFSPPFKFYCTFFESWANFLLRFLDSFDWNFFITHHFSFSSSSSCHSLSLQWSVCSWKKV